MVETERQRIVIVGAGLAGALLACMLGEAGYSVGVYERRPDPRIRGLTGGRSINLALSVRGIHALQRAGLAETVLTDAIPMRGRMIHSPAGRLTFQPYSKNPNDAINSVSRGGLNVTLLDGAKKHPNVRVHFEHRCIDVDIDNPSVTLLNTADNETTRVDADIVIGCDGAFSAVRARMQLVDQFDYSQTYLGHGYKELTVPPTRGGEFAMEPHALHIWPRGGSMMIALPNRDRSFTCTLFWPFVGPGSFEAVKSDDEIHRFFQANFRDAVELMPSLVEDYRRNPTSSLVTVRCSPWFYQDKVVLVGDAAHAVVPFYGQGMNAAFEDCVALVECLVQSRSDRHAAFERYFHGRKVNADAIADLAIGNFIEMRDRVASPVFRLRKRAERVLHRFCGRWYTPLYNMVTFSRIPYAQARRKAAKQVRDIVVLSGLLLSLLAVGILVAVWSLR
ncbi:MAG: NAD(P)/FAD-dependent oxidoreductase [Planctomycetota bacterium]|nr:NAD(P)/FAD-dependent oxidoreductase [Planctomycetota bacterium]MCZ6810741.1 NAD(P)/FAD-dependent oxidoreductase [Planctomycetota bacterium]MCZ6851831.1 NAD(P)/FAD-dependent oxidoreductase [Planctomycetota bacterium]